MTLFKRSWPSAVRSTSAFCPFCDADRNLCKACADKTQFDQWEKHETFPQVFVVMTNTIISQGCLFRAQSCGMSVMLVGMVSVNPACWNSHNEQQVKATAQGERICVLPSFLTDLQHFTSVVCLPLPVMDLDWLYFPCFHICSPYLYAGFYSYIISLWTIFWPVCTAPTLLKPGPRLGLVGIAVIQLKDDNNHLASCYTCLERAG